MFKHKVIFILLLLFAANTLAEVQGVVVRTAALKAQATATAKNIRMVRFGEQITVKNTLGGWVLVETQKDKKQGWLRRYQYRSNIRPGTLQISNNSSNNTSTLASLSRDAAGLFGTNKPKQEQTVVATIGVRGLSEQELQNAKPNPAEFKKMQSFASNKNQARQHAKQIGLVK